MSDPTTGEIGRPQERDDLSSRRPVVWIAPLPAGFPTPDSPLFRFLVYGAICYVAAVFCGHRYGSALATQMHESAVLVALFVGIVFAWRIGCAVVFHPAGVASRLALRNGASQCESEQIRHLLIDCAGFGRRPLLRWSDSRGTDFLQRLAVHGLASNHTIVDSSLRTPLEKIHLIPATLEPERIQSRDPMGRFEAISLATMIVPIVIFVRLALAGQAKFLPAVAICVGIVVFGASRYFDLRLGESLAPIAGMGIVMDRNGRRWTVNDSSMLIRPIANGNGLTVELLGPEGYLLIRLRRGLEDQGFQTLWQRWMHPHPRPELM